MVESGLPIVIIPVDLTLDWPMTEEHRSRIGKAGGRDTELLAKWIDKWREVTRTFPENIPFFDMVYYHDPIAAVYINHPELFETERLSLIVDERSGEVSLGSGRVVEVCVGMREEVIDEMLEVITGSKDKNE